MNKGSIFEIYPENWFSLEDFEGEVWKDIPGFEGCYRISNCGRVKSISRMRQNSHQVIPSRILKYGDNGHGYIIVNLYKNNIGHMKYVHRLVAIAFLPNPLNLPEVNHKDEDKFNNKLENLEWCTGLYNTNYGTGLSRAKRTREDNGWCRSIDMYDIEGHLLKTYKHGLDTERDGLSRRAVYNVCVGRTKSYKGCVFRFSGEPFSYREYDKQSIGKKKKVVKTNLNGNVVCVYSSIKEAQSQNGMKRNTLYSATYASTRKALIDGYYYEIIKNK